MLIDVPKGDNFILILAGLSDSQRDFILLLSKCNAHQLLVHLENFTQWVWQKGDLLCWYPVFNQFDSILADYISHRKVKIDKISSINENSFESRLVEAILKASIVILENCTSKNYYNSLDRLTELLEDLSPKIVYLSSRLITIYFNSKKKIAVHKESEELVDKLLLLSEDILPDSSYSKTITHPNFIPPLLDYYLKSTSYPIKRRGYVTLKSLSGENVKIGVSDIQERRISDMVNKYNVTRLELIRKITVFRAATSPTIQKLLVNTRFANLTSILILNKKRFVQFIHRNPSFIFELSLFISNYDRIDMLTMTLACELLSSLIYDGMQFKLLASIFGVSSPCGPFINLLKSFLQYNEHNASSDNLNTLENAQAREYRMNILLHLLNAYLAIVSYHGNNGPLISSSVLGLLVGFLNNRDPVAIPVIIYIVHLFITLFDYSQSIGQVLRVDHSIFSAFASRIDHEFKQLTSDSSPADSSPNYPINEANDIAINMSAPYDCSSKVIFDWWYKVGERNAKAFLLSTLIKDLDVFAHIITDFQESFDIFSSETGIIHILKWIFQNPTKLDLCVYASSLTLISDILNQDPVVITNLVETGVISTLLDSITLESIKYEDIFSSITTLISDLFAHPAGKQAIRAKNYYPIPLLLSILTKHDFILFDRFGEVSNNIAETLEEIVRNDTDSGAHRLVFDILFETLENLASNAVSTLKYDEVDDIFDRGKTLFGLSEKVDGHHFYADLISNLGKFLMRFFDKAQPLQVFIKQGGFGLIVSILNSPLLPPLFPQIFTQHPMVEFLHAVVDLSESHILDILSSLCSSLDLYPDDSRKHLSQLALLYRIFTEYSKSKHSEEDVNFYDRVDKTLIDGHPFFDEHTNIIPYFHNVLFKVLIVSSKLVPLLNKFINASQCLNKKIILSTSRSNVHYHSDAVPAEPKSTSQSPSSKKNKPANSPVVTADDLFWVTQCGFAYHRPHFEFSSDSVSFIEYEIWRITLYRFKVFISILAKDLQAKWDKGAFTHEYLGHAIAINSFLFKLTETLLSGSFIADLQKSKYLVELVDILQSIHFSSDGPRLLFVYLFAYSGGFSLLAKGFNSLNYLEGFNCNLVNYNLFISSSYLERVSNSKLYTEANSGPIKLDLQTMIKSIHNQLNLLGKDVDIDFDHTDCFNRWDMLERAYHQNPALLSSLQPASQTLPIIYPLYVQFHQLEFDCFYASYFSKEEQNMFDIDNWIPFRHKLKLKEFSTDSFATTRESSYYNDFKQSVHVENPAFDRNKFDLKFERGDDRVIIEKFIENVFDCMNVKTLPWILDLLTRLVELTEKESHVADKPLAMIIKIIFHELGLKDREHNRLYALFFLLSNLLHRFNGVLSADILNTDNAQILFNYTFNPPKELLDGRQHYLVYSLIALSLTDSLKAKVTLYLDLLNIPSLSPNLVSKALELINLSLDDSASIRMFNSYDAATGNKRKGSKIGGLEVILNIDETSRPRGFNLIVTSIALKSLSGKRFRNIMLLGQDVAIRIYNSILNSNWILLDFLIFLLENVIYKYSSILYSEVKLSIDPSILEKYSGLLSDVTTELPLYNVIIEYFTVLVIAYNAPEYICTHFISLVCVADNFLNQPYYSSTVMEGIISKIAEAELDKNDDEATAVNAKAEDIKLEENTVVNIKTEDTTTVNTRVHNTEAEAEVNAKPAKPFEPKLVVFFSKLCGNLALINPTSTDSFTLIKALSHIFTRIDEITGNALDTQQYFILLQSIANTTSSHIFLNDKERAEFVDEAEFDMAEFERSSDENSLDSAMDQQIVDGEILNDSPSSENIIVNQQLVSGDSVINVTLSVSTPRSSSIESSIYSNSDDFLDSSRYVTESDSVSDSYSETDAMEDLPIPSSGGDTPRLPHEASSSTQSVVSSEPESESDHEQVPRIRLPGELNRNFYPHMHHSNAVHPESTSNLECNDVIYGSPFGYDFNNVNGIDNESRSRSARGPRWLSSFTELAHPADLMQMNYISYEAKSEWESNPIFNLPTVNPALLPIEFTPPRPEPEVNPETQSNDFGEPEHSPPQQVNPPVFEPDTNSISNILSAIAWCLGISIRQFLDSTEMDLTVLNELPVHIRHEAIIQQLSSLNLSGIERNLPESCGDEVREVLSTNNARHYLDALPLAYRLQITRLISGSPDSFSMSSIENITLGIILDNHSDMPIRDNVDSWSSWGNAVEAYMRVFCTDKDDFNSIRANLKSKPLKLDEEQSAPDAATYYEKLIKFVLLSLRHQKQINKKIVHEIFYNISVNNYNVMSYLIDSMLNYISEDLKRLVHPIFSFKLLQHLRSLQISLPSVTNYILGLTKTKPGDNKRRKYSRARVSIAKECPLEKILRGFGSELFQTSLSHSAQIVSLAHFSLFNDDKLGGASYKHIVKYAKYATAEILKLLSNPGCSTLWLITHYGTTQQTFKFLNTFKESSPHRAQVASICALAIRKTKSINKMLRPISEDDLVTFNGADTLHRLYLIFVDISLVDDTAGRQLEPFFYSMVKRIKEAFISTKSEPFISSVLIRSYFGIVFRKIASEYACRTIEQLDDVLTSTALRLSEQKENEQPQAIGCWVPEEHLDVVEFSESNKVVLNDMMKSMPTLLQSTLEALVRLAPFTLNFENKRSYFRSSLKEARGLRNPHNLPFALLPNRTEEEIPPNPLRFEPIKINVRREHVFMDSYYQLRNRTADEMKGKLFVTFIGEDGIDAGGLSREWFSILAREMFNPNYALFRREGIKSEFNHPNPLSSINPDHLNFFKFIGRVIGKAIYDSQHLDAYFCRSFYKHMLRRRIVMTDAESVDPEFYGNLKKIITHKLDDLGLELYFSTEIDEFGKVKVVDLIPDGRNILVTEDNKHEYVRLMCNHKVSSGIQEQLEAFLEGFYQLIPPKLIGIFDDKELELLISGVPTIDLNDLIANVDYVNYTRNSPQIVWLWQVLEQLDQDVIASFLQFVTGTSRVPIGGFKYLMGTRGPQRMSIHRVAESDRLPSAHTCFNQLDLPTYSSMEVLRSKLLLALSQGKEGFGFI